MPSDVKGEKELVGESGYKSALKGYYAVVKSALGHSRDKHSWKCKGKGN